ncbi:DUF4588 domain containing protein [Euroglyphus maynei]|uniref:DUF4588 domain containing protein n=1 Tax=Euroglyphus maynei TaxID=6958 RepID=A0A1Y3B2H7_EURMA|nr:DUF4588 domain containing protein [Euroglyphus maynei]
MELFSKFSHGYCSIIFKRYVCGCDSGFYLIQIDVFLDNLSTAHNVWSTFQQASTSVTCLYKESSDFHRKHYDRYRQIGYHKRTKDLLNWIKKKKNLIRREDLLAFLGNGGPHYHHSHNNNNHHHHTIHRSNRRTTTNHRSNLNNNTLMNRLDLASKLTLSPNETDNDSINNVEPNLETFKEALRIFA